MKTPLILLIEDERAGDKSLEPALTRQGFHVQVCRNGADAIKWVQTTVPDIVVFDAATMLSSGVRSCREIRKVLQDTPIIHTRSNGEPKDASAGADVYLMKPFTARKVLNRVRALLPVDQYEEETVLAGELTFFRSKPSVILTGHDEKRLTPKQAHLLETFLRHPNQVLSRRQLMQEVWDTDYVGDTRTLDVHIRWVREAVEADPANPKRITTVRGVGYVYELTAD
jgi:DNA-binding response OmpR family regulator